MFPGRLAHFTLTGSTGADFTKLQRSACAGSNYVWIMWEGVADDGKSECEVNE